MSPFWRQFADVELLSKLAVLIGVAGLECLVAVWAATSRRHWFWRALAVWAAVMLMVPIRAWEAAWVFGVSSPLILGVLVMRGLATTRTAHFAEQDTATKTMRGSRPRQATRSEPCFAAQNTATPTQNTATQTQASNARWRFSLLDLLLLMAIVGLWIHGVLIVVRNYQPANWLGWLTSSIGLTVLAVISYACAGQPRNWLLASLLAAGMGEILIAYWLGYPLIGAFAAAASVGAFCLAFGRRHWLAVAAALVAIPTIAAAACWAGTWMRSYYDFDFTSSFGPLVLIEAVLVLGMTIVIALSQAAARSDASVLWRGVAGAAAGALLLTASARVGQIYWRMLANTSPAPMVARFETPENHFARIAEIAKRVRVLDPAALTGRVVNGRSVDVWRSTPAPPALQALYDELLTLLDAPNAVPYDAPADATAAYERAAYAYIENWRFLVRSLQAEARRAALNEQPDQAAEMAVGMVRLGDMLDRGGLVLDSLLGDSFRRIGHTQLMELGEGVSAERLRKSLVVLRRSVAEQEGVSSILARQAHFDEQLYGWHMQFHHALATSHNASPNDTLTKMYREMDLITVSVLETELAIRLFRLERGHLPATLDDLAPGHLPSAPLDPYDQALHYRVTGDEYTLYSSGWDREDNGGNFGTYYQYLNYHPMYSAAANVKGLQRPMYDFDLKTLTREGEEAER